MRFVAAFVLAGSLLLPAACATPVGPPATHPERGIGDPYYPADGNQGYDVRRYDVVTTYDPTSAAFSSTTTVRATATEDRARLDLDLTTAMTVTAVSVDGQAARFSRVEPHELVVAPATPLVRGRDFAVTVAYHGSVGDSGPVSGWHPLSGGGGVMAGEPHSCAFWYPCNDHPTDKATFHLTATVPARFTVVSGGLQGPTTRHGSGSDSTRTFRWHLDVPTATYLTTILIDELTVRRSSLADGTPVLDAYSPGALRAQRNEARLPAILHLLESRFGRYPAPAAGGLFIDARIGFSLETFTRPVYTAGVAVSTIVHENAHQWWGDNVSIRRWRDICLNECMASYAQWLWSERSGVDLDARYRSTVASIDFSAPLYDMGPGSEFDFAGVYLKGAYFEHALRRLVGDDAAYFEALKGIQADFAGSNLSMLQLRDELSRRTGVDLRSFWDDWVLSTGRPSDANLLPGTLAG